MYIKDRATNKVYEITIREFKNNNLTPDFSSDLLADDNMKIFNFDEYYENLLNEVESINNGSYIEWYGTLVDNFAEKLVVECVDRTDTFTELELQDDFKKSDE